MEELISRFYDRACSWGGRIVGGRFWKLKSAALAVLVAVMMSFPSYGHLKTITREWRPVLDKIEQPFVQKEHLDHSHDSKLTFRLVVPILGHLLGFGVIGCLVVQALAGVALIYLAVGLGFSLSGDRRIGLFTGLTVASIWPGITGFVELRPMMDSVALAFLLGSMAARNPFLIATCVFLSGWSDERGLIASCLVFLFHGIVAAPPQSARIFAFPRAGQIGVVCGWATYFATRFAVSRRYQLPTSTGGIGPGTLVDQFNMLPMGVWSGLEGGWLLVGAVFLLLLRARAWGFLAAYLGGTLLIVGVGISVTDVTRSMAYCLPAYFIALKAFPLLERPGMVKPLALLVLTVSFLWPNYYCDADRFIWWYYPMPLEVLRTFYW